MSMQNSTAGTSTSGQPSLTPQRPYTKQGHRDQTVPLPQFGDLIFLRLPFDLSGPVTTRSPSIANSSTTSGRSRPYHPCVVYGVLEQPIQAVLQLTVFVCRSFSTDDPEAWIKELQPADREFMVPLEPSAQGATSLPPPVGFGPPVTFEPDFVLKKRTWVIARNITIALSAGRAYKLSDGRLSLEEMRRLHNQHIKLSSSTPSPDVLPPESFTLSMGVSGTIYLGSIGYESDDDDDNGDPQDQEDDGMDIAKFMEFLHNAAAPMNPYAAKMAKKYADTRKELLENRVFGWMDTIQ